MRVYYEHEAIKIWHGHNLDVLATLDPDSVNCVVTSPPYNQGASPSAKEHPYASRGAGKDWRGYEHNSDALPEPVYQQQQRDLLDALYRVMQPHSSLFYVHKDRLWNSICLSPTAWLPGPFVLRQQIVWDRGSTHRWDGWHFAPVHEYIFWLTKGPLLGRNLGAFKRYSSIWRLSPTSVAGHPAPFPIALPERCLLALTQPDDLVLDPYCGSGTTLRAAKNLGRRALGIDTVESYCELAAQRLSQEVLTFS